MSRKSEKLVKIGDFKHVYDAELAKLTLCNAGIESALMGENAGVSLYHVFDCHIKLMVFENDFERARQILAGKE